MFSVPIVVDVVESNDSEADRLGFAVETDGGRSSVPVEVVAALNTVAATAAAVGMGV